MSKKILLLEFSESVLANVQQQVARPGLEFFRGANLEDVRAVLARTDIDLAIMGAKLSGNPSGYGAGNLSGKRQGERAYEAAVRTRTRRLPRVCPSSPSRTC